MKRRPFLLGTTAVAVGLVGCTADRSESPAGTGTRTETPAETLSDTRTTPKRGPPECVDPERPEPENVGEDVEPATYPGTPPTPEDTEAMADYVVAYEEAYRTNDLLENYGSDLEEVQLGIGDPRFFDSASGSTIARVRYTYGFQTSSAIADSPTTYASYYVDDSVVSRAEHEGVLDDESSLEPDPLADGNVLDCFE